MTITGLDGLIDGLGNKGQPFLLNKASIANAAAGQFFDLFRATGVPAQGAIPGAAAICDRTLLGSIGYNNPVPPDRNYLAGVHGVSPNAGHAIFLYDRLGHMGGLSGTVTTAQTANLDLTLATSNLAARRGAANYSDIQWYLAIFTDLGATGVNATVNVDYDDASNGNLAAIALGATPRAGRLYPLIPAVNGRWIRRVVNVTLSATTGAAGSFGFVGIRRLTPYLAFDVAQKGQGWEWAQLNLPRIHDDACLCVGSFCITTSTGTLVGGGAIATG